VETIVVIVIVGLAAAYVGRNFYLKFRRGKSGGAGCGCPSCGSTGACDRQPAAGKPSDACTIRDER